MSEISRAAQQLIGRYKTWHQHQQQENAFTIHVDEVASKAAAFYEKIREVVDWREEHLMKRAAISRMLKRRLILTKNSRDVAESLILELIRGGHFPNDKIPESKFGEVEKIIDKYVFILKNSPNPPKNKTKIQLSNWIFNIAACEIEEVLALPQREIALMDYMTELMQEQIKMKPGVISDEEKNTQIYIAVQRALFKLDAPIISYYLLKKYYPREIANDNIYTIWDDLEKKLNHPLADKFYSICERYDTPYLLLGDVLSEINPADAPEKILNPATLEGLIRQAYNKRLATLKKRLYRAAAYSTLSIFSTNIFSFFVLEIYLAKLIGGSFTPITVAVDILGPTFLMFLLMVTVKTPAAGNLDVAVMETIKIIYQREKLDIYEIKIPKKRGFISKLFIAFFYLLGAGISLGTMFWIFELASFPPTSIVINIVFVALIIFTGLAIRNRAEELTVQEKKPSFFGFIFDILLTPIAGLGNWLSNEWRQYNALTVFFSTLVDVPFTVFVEFIEQWRFFLKEEKEKLH